MGSRTLRENTSSDTPFPQHRNIPDGQHPNQVEIQRSGFAGATIQSCGIGEGPHKLGYGARLFEVNKEVQLLVASESLPCTVQVASTPYSSGRTGQGT